MPWPYVPLVQDPALCALRGTEPRGHTALWPEACFVNHSCAPSTHGLTVEDRLLLRTTQELPAGACVCVKEGEGGHAVPGSFGLVRFWLLQPFGKA